MSNILLYNIIKKNWKDTLIAIIFKILFAISITIMSYSLTFLFDSYKLGQNRFFRAICILGFIILVTVLLSFLSDYFKARYLKSSNILLKTQITDNVVGNSSDLIAERDTGKAISWFINDAKQIETQAFENILTFIYMLSLVISAFISIFILHWSIALVSVAFLLISLVIPNLSQKYVVIAQEKYTRANEEYTEAVRDNMEGLSLFFLGDALASFISRMNNASTTKEEHQFRFSMTQAKVGSVVLLVSLFSQIGLIIFTLYISSIGLTTIGSVFSIASLSGNLFNGIQGLTSSITIFKSSDVLLQKFQTKTVNETIEVDSRVNNISLADISFQYDNHVIFDDFSQTFMKGRKYAIIGESGSGKSTLLQLLLGLKQAKSGSIFINGCDLNAINLKSYYKRIAYIDQSIYLINGSIRENITLGKSISDQELAEVVEKTQLSSFVGENLSGLDRKLVSNGLAISGGEKQRIALARAIVKDVDFIIIDETTSQLDKENRLAIEETILGLQDIGVIYISHNTESKVLELFDEVLDSRCFK